MTKTTDELRTAIVRKAVREEFYLGMQLMGLLPDSIQKLKELGIEMNDNQRLRSLATIYKGTRFAIFLLEDNKGGNVWALWEILPNANGFCGYAKNRIWRGYIKKSLEEVIASEEKESGKDKEC